MKPVFAKTPVFDETEVHGLEQPRLAQDRVFLDSNKHTNKDRVSPLKQGALIRTGCRIDGVSYIERCRKTNTGVL